ncbi:hypothetical protein [Catelliglobosispora koreensis]|uniref:hypothetical protein n=1 Tax=Catelliglobosispora koreensis TaxID=129052 RepID=UPI00039C6E61|nr:hypothetical protein [Catelliglobosispora koreensis]
MNHPKNLRELIAANIQRLRSATAGVGPEDIARAATNFGLSWTPAWVTGVEKGQKALTAEQLIALPFVLSSALGHRISLSDLFLGDASIHLGEPVPGTSLSPSYLREVITATPFRRPFLDLDLPDPADADAAAPSPVVQAAEKMREITRAGLGDVDVRALKRAEEGAGEAEAKLAKKLNVAEIVVIAAAASLWGRSLTEERDAQLEPEDSVKTSRATLTRKMSAQIVEKLEQAEASVSEAAMEELRSHVANSNEATALYPIIRPREPIPFTQDVTFDDDEPHRADDHDRIDEQAMEGEEAMA